MKPEKPLGLTWGENANREEDGTVHVEWHAPCGCAFHPEPFPHVHPCGDGHKRPDLNIVTTAPPSTSEAIRAAAEEIAQHVLNKSGVYEMSERYQQGLGDFTVEGYAKEIAAILSRWFGKGETEQETT